MKRKLFYILIAIITILLRLFMNYSSDLIPGVNGGYYPLQVRTLINEGHLDFNDLPLYFLINMLFVKIISIFNFLDLDSLIIHTSKIIDSITFPLLLIPLYRLNRKLFEYIHPLFVEVSVIAFATLSFSPLVLTSDLQKNAFAITLIFFFFSAYTTYLATRTKEELIQSVIFLILIGLTHLGVFVMSVLAFLFGIVTTYKRKAILPTVITVLSGLMLVFFFDSNRALRLLSFWSEIFNKPTILQGPLLFNYLFTYLLISITTYYLIKKRDNIPYNYRIILYIFR